MAKYTDDDITFLKEHYIIGDWKSIFEKFPKISKAAVYGKMSKL